MADVVNFKDKSIASAKIFEPTVEAIETLLKEAKAGNIRSIGYAYVKNDGYIAEGFVLAPNTNFQMYAAAGVLQARVLDNIRGSEQDI